MAEGLEIFDANGQQVFGPGSSNVTILGVATANKSNGSIVNSNLSRGAPVVISALPLGAGDIVYYMPIVTFSGNTMSWTYEVSGASYNSEFRIIYGVRA